MQASHLTPSSSSTPSKCPRRCKLCNYIEESADSPQDPMATHDQPQQRSCSRCGLMTSCVSEALGPEQRLLMLEEAAKAYEFTINAEMMTRFPPEISKIVVHYLLWYRGPNDFHVGDVVDAQDLRGKWYPATVLCVEKERVLVHYHGWSDKWDTWYARTSSALAPSGSKTGHGVGSDGMGVTSAFVSSGSRVSPSLQANPMSSCSSSAEYIHPASDHLSASNSYSFSSSASAYDYHSALSPAHRGHHHHSTSLSIDRPSISASSSHASLSSLRESRWDDIGMPHVSTQSDDVSFE